MKLLISFIFLALIINGGPNTDATLLPLLLNRLLSQNQPLMQPHQPLLHPTSSLETAHAVDPISSLLHPVLPFLRVIQPRFQPVQPSPILQQGQSLPHPVQISTQYCQMDQSLQFRNALYEFSLNFYNALSDKVNDHFVTSPLSIWQSLAAIAEGAAPEAQPQLFKVLGLPEQFCLRQKFYTIAMSSESPGSDVYLIRHRGIIFDNNLNINEKWLNFVKTSKLLDYATTPIKDNPRSAQQMLQKAIGSKRPMPLQGNSVLIDSLTYKGLWTNAFDDSQISMEPFYDNSGVQIGTVPMMRIKLRTRIAALPLIQAKVVELPVGNDGRYMMFIGLGMDKSSFIRKLVNSQHGKVIDEVISLLTLTPGPIEIAIPKMAMNTEFDARIVLEEMGITDIWTDPAATEYVSSPAALPGGFVQHVKMAFIPGGITPPPSNNVATDLLGDIVNAVGNQNFIANKPFSYALVESKTLNVLFTGCYSDPNRDTLSTLESIEVGKKLGKDVEGN